MYFSRLHCTALKPALIAAPRPRPAVAAGGGARITSDIASAMPTSTASAGQSMRWALRWARLIADDVI